MVSKDLSLFPGRETVKLCYCEIIFVKCFDIVKFCYKLIIGKAEGLFAILVVWSVSYPLGGASNHLAFMGKWPTVFSLIHPKDEFELSFKEMRMWSQSKISSCFIYDWCKSRVVGGRESQRLPTPMVESFFADHLPAKKSYWRVAYKIVAYNAISVGLGRQKRLFCVCAAESIIIVIINIIVYIYCCGGGGSLHSVVFVLFCCTKLCTDPHVNKDFFLLEFFSKDSLSCSKVGVCLSTCLNKTPAFHFFFSE